MSVYKRVLSVRVELLASLLVFALGLAVWVEADTPIVTTVDAATPVCLCPPRTGLQLADWGQNDTIKPGMTRSYAGQTYWAVNSGRTTNAPTVTVSGVCTGSDGIVWARFNNNTVRKGLRVTLITTNNMYVSVGIRPTTNSAGIFLYGKGATFEPANVPPNEAIYGISEGGDASPVAQDW